MFERFKDIVKEGRPASRRTREALDKLATGEIFTADQALDSKLIDKIGFLEDAIDRALELAKLDKDEDPRRQVQAARQPVRRHGVAQARPARRLSSWPQLLDLSAPRGWYLATSLPAIVTSRRAD